MKPRKRRWRRFWSRRGISTVVAEVMMIGITLSLAAILVAWAGSSYGAFSGGTGVYYQQRGQALEENFVIEQVFFEKNSTSGEIFVFVRNVGLININLAAIYYNGTSLSFSTTCPQSGGLEICCPGSGTPTTYPIAVSQVCEFAWIPSVGGDAGSGSNWNSGTVFIITVASQRGNQVSTTMRGP